MTRWRYTLTILTLLLLLLTVVTRDARATSFAQAVIGGTSPLEDNETVAAFVSSGGNSASSFVHPLSETLGAAVSSDGTVFDVRASASHSDDWTCSGGCSALSAPLTLSAGINFDAVLSGDITKGRGEFTLTASYSIGSDVYTFSADADSTPIETSASFDGDPVSVTVTTDTLGNVHLSTSFVRTIVCPCFATDAPLFSDSQSISLEMEGNGTIDAFHTFTVTLTPLDPGIVLTSSDGRTIGTAPSAEPVPEPASLLLLGAGLIPLSRRLRRR
jgi:PEP-CTERM motif